MLLGNFGAVIYFARKVRERIRVKQTLMLASVEQTKLVFVSGGVLGISCRGLLSKNFAWTLMKIS